MDDNDDAKDEYEYEHDDMNTDSFIYSTMTT